MGFSEEGGRFGPGVKAPKGGYRLVWLDVLYAAWWAKLEKALSLLEFRAYVACHEVMASRAAIYRKAKQKGRGRGEALKCVPRCSFDEIAKLTGASVQATRRAVGKLEQLGFLTWSEERIRFSTTTDELALDTERLDQALTEIDEHHRLIPVTRRTLRLLARGCSESGFSSARTAVILAKLTRCAWWRRGLLYGRGNCTLDFVVRVFGACRRAALAAIKWLVNIRWFLPSSSQPAWHRRRNGQRGLVNFCWDPRGEEAEFGTVGAESVSGSAPESRLSTTGSAPPKEDQKTPSNEGVFKDQETASGRTGFSIPTFRKKARKLSLADVRPEHLADPAGLRCLFEEATSQGFTNGSEHHWRNFLALAARALRVATNPGGFFIAALRRGTSGTGSVQVERWFVSGEDERGAEKLLVRENHLEETPAHGGGGGRHGDSPGLLDRVKAVASTLGAAFLSDPERTAWENDRRQEIRRQALELGACSQ